MSNPCQKEDIIGLLVRSHEEMQKKIEAIHADISQMRVDVSSMNTVLSQVVVNKVNQHDAEIVSIRKDVQGLKDFRIKALFYIGVFSVIGGFLFELIKDNVVDLIK